MAIKFLKNTAILLPVFTARQQTTDTFYNKYSKYFFYYIIYEVDYTRLNQSEKTLVIICQGKIMIKRRTTKSATPSTVRKVNISEVLQALWTHDSLSRAEITSILGLSATTMAKLMNSLVRDSIIIEVASDEAAGKGRPSKHYRLNNKQIGIIIVLIGISHTRVAACSPDGRTIFDDERKFKTPGNYTELINTIRSNVEKVAKNFSKNATIALGLSVPGMIRECDHYVELSPNIQYLNGKKPVLDICQKTNYYPTTIQEERALCLAQCTDPQYSQLSDLVALDLSEGFGLGILSSNSLVNGSRGFAGELGHVTLLEDGPLCACGKRGCFEVLASDTALINEASKAVSRHLTFEEIASLINDGDPVVTKVIEEICKNIAKAIAIAINMLNPQAVLLHARMLEIKGYNVLNCIKKHIRQDALEELVNNCIVAQAPISRRYGVSKSASELLFSILVSDSRN